MASTDLPDFLKDMNAVLKHVECKWLNGTPPDYSASNKLYSQGRLVEQCLSIYLRSIVSFQREVRRP